MILVTVGAQMPFDRMVKAVDRWAADRHRDDVYAQIGPTDYRPSHVQWTAFLEPEEFERRSKAAKVIVAHAGTGSILMALQLGKPIVVMPRLASLRETRSDHQVATAERFSRFGSVNVAWDEDELVLTLDRVDGLVGEKSIGPYASTELIREIRGFVEGACQA